MLSSDFFLRAGKLALFGLAFVGFAIYPNVLYPDVFTKGLYVRLLVLLAFVFFLWWSFMSRRRPLFSMSPLAAGVLLFGGTAIVSMIFSTSIFRSFWGEAQRMEGVLGLLHYALLFFVVREVFSKRDWFTYMKCVLVTVPPLSLYAILQYVSADMKRALPLIFSVSGQPGSLFGNPAFFSTFLIFAMGFGAMLYAYEASRAWRMYALLSIAVSFVMILWVGVRGQVLGAIVGIVAFAALSAWRGRQKKHILAFLVGAGALVVIGIGLVVFRPTLGEYYPNLIVRIVNLPNEPSFYTRWLSLQSSREAFLDSPRTVLVGWGQEHFMTGYNKYYSSEHGTYEDAWFDRAHNKLADVLVTGGLLGMLAYLLLWGMAGRRILLLLKDSRWAKIGAAAGGLLIAYFAQNLTTFDLPQTYANFFILLAFLDAFSRPETASAQSNVKSLPNTPRGGMMLPLGITAAVAVAAFFTIVIPLRQSERYLFYFKTHKGDELYAEWDKVFSPKNFVHYTLVDDMWRRLQDQEALRDPNFLPVTDRLAGEMEYLMERDSTDAQMALRLGSVYTNQGLGLSETDAAAAAVRFERGEAFTRRALALSPGRQEIYYVLAFNLQGQQEGEEAVKVIHDAIALNPKTKKAKYYLAVNEALIGKLDEAVREIEEVRALGWFQGFRLAETREVIRIYQAAKRTDLLPGLLKELLTLGYNRDRETFILLLRSLIRERNAAETIHWAEEYKKAYPVFAAPMDELIQLVERGEWGALAKAMETPAGIGK